MVGKNSTVMVWVSVVTFSQASVATKVLVTTYWQSNRAVSELVVMVTSPQLSNATASSRGARLHTCRVARGHLRVGASSSDTMMVCVTERALSQSSTAVHVRDSTNWFSQNESTESTECDGHIVVRFVKGRGLFQDNFRCAVVEGIQRHEVKFRRVTSSNRMMTSDSPTFPHASVMR